MKIKPSLYVGIGLILVLLLIFLLLYTIDYFSLPSIRREVGESLEWDRIVYIITADCRVQRAIQASLFDYNKGAESSITPFEKLNTRILVCTIIGTYLREISRLTKRIYIFYRRKILTRCIVYTKGEWYLLK